MKNNFKYFLSALVLLAVVASCKKDEHKISYEGGTPPVLTPSSTAPLVLTSSDATKPAIKFTWTNPNYQFTTGLSSQDVTYVLQVDTTGANFSSKNKQEVSIAKDLSTQFTVKELNAVLAKLNLLENMTHNVEFRLKSTLIGGSVPLYSNVVKMVITPYLDVAVPIPTNGTLWATGDATGAGWANPLGAPYDVSQKFTKISNTLYELTLNMPGGGNYKLIQEQGQWGSQYHMLSGGTWNGGSFEQKDSDPGFPGPPSGGTYKITVNFKTGLYTVVKL
jgi:hypothetical protein